MRRCSRWRLSASCRSALQQDEAKDQRYGEDDQHAASVFLGVRNRALDPAEGQEADQRNDGQQ